MVTMFLRKFVSIEPTTGPFKFATQQFSTLKFKHTSRRLLLDIGENTEALKSGLPLPHEDEVTKDDIARCRYGLKTLVSLDDEMRAWAKEVAELGLAKLVKF